MKVKSIFFTISLMFLLVSCKNDSKTDYWTMEVTEVFSVINKDKEAIKGDLTFKETKVTDGNGDIQEHWYYNRDGQLTTFERYIYSDNNKLPFKSNFYDQRDSLLSYYIFEYDQKGNKIKTSSFDAASNELLRIELFEYDSNNNRIKRQIQTAGGQTVRKYEFRFDKEGNESTYSVYDGDGNILVAEAFSITKSDENGWTEKWSFRKEKPSTIKTRRFANFLPKEITEVR